MVEAGRKPLVPCLRRLEKLGLLDRGNNLAAPPGPRVGRRVGLPFGRFQMRWPIFSLFLIAVALVGEIRAGSAQSPTSYPWCARVGQRDGPTSCYYKSYEQCMTTLSGGAIQSDALTLRIFVIRLVGSDLRA